MIIINIVLLIMEFTKSTSFPPCLAFSDPSPCPMALPGETASKTRFAYSPSGLTMVICRMCMRPWWRGLTKSRLITGCRWDPENFNLSLMCQSRSLNWMCVLIRWFLNWLQELICHDSWWENWSTNCSWTLESIILKPSSTHLLSLPSRTSLPGIYASGLNLEINF
jgi:hypothetical protein